MLLHHSIDRCDSLARGSDGIDTMRIKVRLEALQHSVRLTAARYDFLYEMVLVHLGTPGQKSRHDGDADASTDIPHKVEDASRVPHLFGLDASHRQRHQGNEQKTQRHPLQNLRPENIPETRLQVQPGELEHRERPQNDSDDEQFSRVMLRGQMPG